MCKLFVLKLAVRPKLAVSFFRVLKNINSELIFWGFVCNYGMKFLRRAVLCVFCMSKWHENIIINFKLEFYMVKMRGFYVRYVSCEHVATEKIRKCFFFRSSFFYLEFSCAN